MVRHYKQTFSHPFLRSLPKCTVWMLLLGFRRSLIMDATPDPRLYLWTILPFLTPNAKKSSPLMPVLKQQHKHNPIIISRSHPSTCAGQTSVQYNVLFWISWISNLSAQLWGEYLHSHPLFFFFFLMFVLRCAVLRSLDNIFIIHSIAVLFFLSLDESA